MLNNIKNFLPLILITFLSTGCGIFGPIEKPDYGNGDEPTTKRAEWEKPTLGGDIVEKVDTIDWNVTEKDRVTEKDNSEEIEKEDKEKEGETSPVTTIKMDTTAVEEVAIIEAEKMLKNYYTVVIMMPFLGNQFTSYGPIPERSKRALEFYEGVKMAITDLQSQGVPMTIYVFDTQYDENVVKGLLNSSALFSADLIIGPVNKKNCQLVADFSRRNGKVMVSPYNYLSTITEQNPYYVQATPSTQMQFVRLLEHLKANYGSTSVATIVYPYGKKAIQERVQEIQFASNIVNQSGGMNLREYQFDVASTTADSPMRVDEFMVSGQKNVIIIPSRDPAFVAYAMRELSPYRTSHNITVIGLPQWEDKEFEKLDYNYYENMGLLIGSESYINKDNPQITNFISRYAGEYSTLPTENVFKGYDIMLYFGQMLGEFGIYFPSFLSKNTGNALHTNFNFQPVYGIGTAGTEGKPVIKRFENNHVNILEFSDYQFRKVN